MKKTMKRCASILLMVLVLASLITAVMPAFAATVKTTSISLSKKGTVKINIGQTLDLNAKVSPATSTQTVSWRSSKASVATVDAEGVVTGVKVGTITVTARSGARSASVKVKVVDPTMPTSVKLDRTGTVKLAIGAELNLNATMKPATAVSGLTWKSSKSKYATVSNGVVKGVRAGTTKITVTTARGGKKATVKVKVYDPYLPSSVKLDKKGTVKLAIGSELTLTPTLKPATAQSGFTWKSSKKKYATVSNGVVKGVKVGTTTITVTTRNKKKASVKVKVYDPYLPSSVALDKTGTQKLALGKTLSLTPVLKPATAQSGFTWKSSNKRVAKVSSTGVVTPVLPGTATITVTTRNNKKAKIKIKVYDDGTVPITTPADYTSPYVIYACKQTHTIAILAQDEKGNWNRVIRLFPTGMGRKGVTDVGYFRLAKKERWHKWGSGYSPYANMVSVGIYLHGPIYKTKSNNTIRVDYYNCIGTDCSSGCLRTTCGCAAWVYYNCPVGTYITIADNARFSTSRPTKLKSNATMDPTDPGSNPEILITKFSVTPNPVSLLPGEKEQLNIQDVKPANNSTGNAFTYTSSDTSIATVSSSGLVTGMSPGSATITVVAKDDYKATIRVPVTVNNLIAGAEPVEGEEAAETPENASTDKDDTQIVAPEPTPTAQPVEVPAVTPTEAPIVAPAVTPTEAPVEAPVVAPDATPVEETPEEATETPEDGVETIISGTESDPVAEVTEDLGNGLTIYTEDLEEEQSDIVLIGD